MVKPNFFIVGAARSGTTSIYNYLKQHPEIFLSEIKEPRFLSSKYNMLPHNGPGDKKIDDHTVKSDKKYFDLFKNINSEKIIGEGSTENLYYYKTADRIKTLAENPRILILLRNPVGRAYSSYWLLVSQKREKESFENALKLEEDRIKQNYEFIWHYKNVGLYYNQVKYYLETFNDSNVKIVIFDDLKENPDRTLNDILRFLGLNSDYKINFKSKYNASGSVKNKFIYNLIKKNNVFKKFIKCLLPRGMSRKLGRSVMNKNYQKPEMNTETEAYLKKYFKRDVEKLEMLIDRKLNFWLE